MSLMMVLSLWDISIESIDGVGRLGGTSRASEDRVSKLLKVVTPLLRSAALEDVEIAAYAYSMAPHVLYWCSHG